MNLDDNLQNLNERSLSMAQEKWRDTRSHQLNDKCWKTGIFES